MTNRPDQLDRELSPGLMSDEEIDDMDRVANREAMLAARRRSGDPTEPRDDSDRLKPCPFCGGEAEICNAEGAGSNAYVVQCTEQRCLTSSRVIYACGDDPNPLLLEAWNRRSVSSNQLGDEQ